MATTKLKIDSIIPSFKLPAVDGNEYSVLSFSDKKILIIVFSCNHCPYVQAYEDRLMDIQTKYSSKSLQLLAISSNNAVKYPEDSFEQMKERSIMRIFNFPYLYDESQDVAKEFGATHTPEVFVFDVNRKLKYHGKIDDNWQEPEKVVNKYLEEAIDEILDSKEVSVPETFSIGCTIKWK